MMMRKCIHLINAVSFLIVQNTFAITRAEMNDYAQFFKDSGLSARPVKLKDILQKYGQSLPKDIRQQAEAFVKESPDIVLPKVDIQKIQKNGTDQLQIIFNDPKSKTNLILSTQNTKNNLFSLVGQVEGVAINQMVHINHFVQLGDVLYKARLDQAVTKLPPMNWYTFNKLKKADQDRFIRSVRNMAALTEKLQKMNAQANSRGGKKSANYIWEALLGEEALAITGSCIVAGWLGDYAGTTKCQLPRANYNRGSCPSGQTQCNPLLYGRNVCIGKDNLIPITATQECNQKAKPIQAYSSLFETDTSRLPSAQAIDAEFDKFYRDLDGEIKNTFKQYCDANNGEIVKRSARGEIGPDQVSTCEQLTYQVQEIAKINTCQNYQEAVRAANISNNKFVCTPAPVAPVPPTMPIADRPETVAQAPRVAESSIPVCGVDAGKKQISTPERPCQCAPGQEPGFDKQCLTAAEAARIDLNAGKKQRSSIAYRTCSIIDGFKYEVSTPESPCLCAPGQEPTLANPCIKTESATAPSTSVADGKKPAGADGDGGSPDSTQAGTDSGVRAQQPPAPVVEATPSPAQVTAPNPEERAKVAVTKKADEATQPPSDEDGRKKACAFLQQSNISFNDGTCGGSGNIKKLRCTGADGKDYDQPYCYCNPGTHLPQIFSEPGMGAFHRGCEKKRTDSDRTSRTSRGSSSNDFWSGFKKVLPFALIGGMMIMQHKAQKEQLDRQYQMYLTQMQSIQPPVPPPSSNVPVDTGGGRIAPTPGATR